MILRPSVRLAKRLKCEFSKPSVPVPYLGTLHSWSGELLRLKSVGSHAIMSNEETLLTVIVPLAGVRDFTQFLPLFLARVAALWRQFDGAFDPLNQTVVVLKRTERALIGSHNDIIRMLRFHVENALDEWETVDWSKAEEFINDTPFKLIAYAHPAEEFARQLGKG